MMKLATSHTPGRQHRPLRSCLRAVLAGLLLSLPAAPTLAQGFGATDYPFYTAPQLSFSAANFMNLSVLNQPQGATAAPSSGVSTVAPPPQLPLHTAETLARAYSPHQPGPLKSVFEQSPDLFGKAAQKAQQPADDVAVALAFFVASNYAAAQGQPLLADARTKREAFEQLAMLGMFIYLAKLELDKNPAAEAAGHFRNHARANLASVLGVPAERVVLDKGLLKLQ